MHIEIIVLSRGVGWRELWVCVGLCCRQLGRVVKQREVSAVRTNRCMQHEHRQARRRRLSRCITHTDLEEVCFVLQPLIFILSICGIQTLNFKEQNSFIVHEQLCTMVVSKIEKKQSAFL